MGKKKYAMWYCLPAFIIYTVLFIVPSVISIGTSFTDLSIFALDNYKFVGFENFRNLFNDDIFLIIFKNTFYYAIVTVILKNVIGFILALLLDNELKATRFYRSVFFMPCILSSMVVCLIFCSIYHPQNGILNETLRALHLNGLTRQWLADAHTAMNSVCAIEVWQWAGFHMTIYLAALQGIDRSYLEAAAIDGASRRQQLFKIKIPLMIGSIGINIVLAIVGGLKVFDKVYATTNGGPNDATQVFSMYIYKTFGQGLLGLSSAYNTVFTLIIAIIAFFVLKQFMKKEVD